ncbi:MAG TPA: hypothetical protein VGL19_23130 [Polyangiaceae bacterium]
MARRDGYLRVLLLAGLLAGCVTDHDALQKRPDAGSSAGAGGVLGGAGAPSVIGGTSGDDATGGHADDEPLGKSLLTLVNGVVDAPSVVLCLAKVDPSGGATPFGQPLTDKPFAYGENLVLTDVSGASVDTDTLEPMIIAGELELIAGLDCEAAVARAQDEEALAIDANTRAAGAGAGGEGGAADSNADAGAGGASSHEQPSRLRVRGLPALPAGTLRAGRSILFVATGCMGGSAYDAPSSEEYCGTGYSEDQPTLSAVLVSLSRRTQFGETGLQFVHASFATPSVDVSSHPPFPSKDTGVQIATGVIEGQASPHSALLTHSALEYGSANFYQVQLSTQGTPVSGEPWLDVLARGGVKSLQDGSTYALVLLGPRADHIQPTRLWNPMALTVVPVEPP